MGLLDLASGKSVWRGMDYYEKKKVVSWKKTGEETYSGVVAGSDGAKYNVSIDKAHPRRSVCNCAFADGRRVVCKHMIALYFTAEPYAAEAFLKQVEEWEKEEEDEWEARMAEIEKYVKSLSKTELQTLLINMLIEEEERDYWR